MKTGSTSWSFLTPSHQTLSSRYRLRAEIGWALLAAMVLCCLLLSIPHLPEEWRPLQNLAAVAQAFISGLIAAQWLPLWEPQPRSGERVAPSTD